MRSRGRACYCSVDGLAGPLSPFSFAGFLELGLSPFGASGNSLETIMAGEYHKRHGKPAHAGHKDDKGHGKEKGHKKK